MPPGQKLPAGSVDLQSHNNEALSEYPPRIRYVNPTEGCSADVPAECPLQSGGDISPSIPVPHNAVPARLLHG